MIDHATRDRIQDAAQIVEVVSDFVTLKRAGANYKGLCPFHDDSTPSFMVSPAKNYSKCFSCGKGGNPITFIMEHEHLSYPDALRYLAKKYNIEIQERELSPQEIAAQNSRDSMMVVNEWANELFQETLHQTSDGRAIGISYLHTRGFRDDIIKKFQIGYCESQGNYMAQKAKVKGFKPEFLLKTGLCYEKNDGSLRDRFWGRIIFPIHSISGKVVAFGGRVLNNATKGVQMKYVNSPESEIYHKGREVYGLYQAKNSISKENRCYIAEGYTDVISMHQCGIENVVSSSGTALTYEQIRLIRRFTRHITLLFDSDEAGIKASLRGIDMLLEEGMSVKILRFPEGEDPDSFARNKSSEEYRAYIEKNQMDFIQYKALLLLKEAENDPIKRGEAITSIVRSIAAIPDSITTAVYIQECSKITGLGEKTLIDSVQKIKKVIQEEGNRHKLRTTSPTATPQQTPPPTSEPPFLPPPDFDALPFGDTAPPPPTALEPGQQSPPATNEGTPVRDKAIYSAEKLLVEVLIKYGDKPLCSIESEDGQTHMMSTAELIVKELQTDGLSFREPIHQRIFNEVAASIEKGQIITEKEFIYHPDKNINSLAGNLAVERYQLSKYHTKSQKVATAEERLFEEVPRLIYAFKYAIVKEELNSCMKRLLDPEVTNNPEKYIEIMTQYKKLQEVSRLLGKELGRFQ